MNAAIEQYQTMSEAQEARNALEGDREAWDIIEHDDFFTIEPACEECVTEHRAPVLLEPYEGPFQDAQAEAEEINKALWESPTRRLNEEQSYVLSEDDGVAEIVFSSKAEAFSKGYAEGWAAAQFMEWRSLAASVRTSCHLR
jgi:hypothetical protein